METTVPSLTRREQEVFEALKSAEGPMPTGQLAAQVFGFSDASALQEVRVWVSRLRAKGIPIRTVLGIGYMIDHCEEGHTWGCVVCGARQADGGTGTSASRARRESNARLRQAFR